MNGGINFQDRGLLLVCSFLVFLLLVPVSWKDCDEFESKTDELNEESEAPNETGPLCDVS